MCDGDINADCDIEDLMTLTFLFPNFNLPNLDLRSYLLIDDNLITENPNVSITYYIDEIGDKIETEIDEGLVTSFSSISEAHINLKHLENYVLCFILCFYFFIF